MRSTPRRLGPRDIDERARPDLSADGEGIGDGANRAAVSAAADGSARLLRAMLAYGLRHGHLLSLSMAQVRARATTLGIGA